MTVNPGIPGSGSLLDQPTWPEPTWPTPLVHGNEKRTAELGEQFGDLRTAVLTTRSLRELPPPSWLIDGLIPADALTLLYGPSGNGKTFVALDIALSIATGTWWHGRPVRTGEVLYVCAESPAGLVARIDAWAEHQQIHGIDTFPARWLARPINLFDPTAAALATGLITTLQPTLLVIDTLAKCTVGADENSARDIGRVVDTLETIRRDTSAAILLVHHSGKNLEQGHRGSSALLGAVDTELEVTTDDGRLTIKNTKQRNAAELTPLRYDLRPLGDSCVIAPRTAIDDTLPAAALDTLETLRAIATPAGVSPSIWLKSAVAVERTFYRHVKALLAAGHVTNVGSDARPKYVVHQEEHHAD